MWKQMNYYALLGVRSDATDQTIREQAENLKTCLPSKTHPRLNKAKRVLGNPVFRAEYDRQVQANGGKHVSNFEMFPKIA